MSVLMTPLTLAILGNLVDPNFVVPARDGKEVGRVLSRREGEVGDAVSGRITEGDVTLEIADRIGRRGLRRRGSE